MGAQMQMNLQYSNYELLFNSPGEVSKSQLDSFIQDNVYSSVTKSDSMSLFELGYGNVIASILWQLKGIKNYQRLIDDVSDVLRWNGKLQTDDIYSQLLFIQDSIIDNKCGHFVQFLAPNGSKVLGAWSANQFVDFITLAPSEIKAHSRLQVPETTSFSWELMAHIRTIPRGGLSHFAINLAQNLFSIIEWRLRNVTVELLNIAKVKEPILRQTVAQLTLGNQRENFFKDCIQISQLVREVYLAINFIVYYSDVDNPVESNRPTQLLRRPWFNRFINQSILPRKRE